MDLTDDASVKQGGARVIVREGRIGVLGNNAGDGLAGQWKIHFNDGLEDAFSEMKKALKRAASRFKKR